MDLSEKTPFPKDPFFRTRWGGGKTYRVNLGGGGKRTAERALQNHFWRSQKLGLVWSVPLSFKGNDRESPKKGGGTYRRWGVQKRFWGGVFRRIYGMFSTPWVFHPPLAALWLLRLFFRNNLARQKIWWEEGCRAASWRKNPFFEILFAALMSTFVRSAGPPVVGVLHWVIVPCWIFMLKCLKTVFAAAFAVLHCGETRTEKKKFAEKFGQIKLFFTAFFRSVFRFSLATWNFEQLYAFKSKKARAEAVLREMKKIKAKENILKRFLGRVVRIV